MKPFNLERAKAGDPIVTRDGRSARYVGHVPEVDEGFRVVAYVEGDAYPSHYFENGRMRENGEDSDHDLFMVPRTRTVYVNVMALHPSVSASGAVAYGYLTERHALAVAANSGGAKYDATAVPLTIEIDEPEDD